MKRIGILVLVAFALSLFSVSAAFAKRDEEFNKALRYYSAKKYHEAAKTLEGYVAQKPDPAAYYLMGYALYKLKKFDEANKHFEEAYAIDPEFSLEKAGLLPKKAPVQAAAKAPAETQKEQPAAKTETGEAQQAAKPAETPAASQKPAEPAKPGAAPQPAPQAVQTPAPAPAPAQQAAPQPKPSFPAAKPGMPPGAGGIMAIVAGFMMIVLIVGVVLYVFVTLCIFLIAKKLDVPAPWTAFVPVVNLWTIVMCAGKPGWWVVLFLIPIVSVIVSIYLWMCIAENLGRNKLLGLLMLVPIVNLIFLGMLAFSKSEGSGMQIEEAA
ncbi:MAG: hypothetical protein OHK006_22910 [Thermodesulfovibrionales bacterium]